MRSFNSVFNKASIATGCVFVSNLAFASEPTPVPEPGPMGLLVLGGVALVIARRFKRNK